MLSDFDELTNTLTMCGRFAEMAIANQAYTYSLAWFLSADGIDWRFLTRGGRGRLKIIQALRAVENQSRMQRTL